jgi:hypothetical protein
MSDSIERLQQRARQYWFQDGLGELAVGLLFLLLGLYFLGQASLPSDSTLYRLLDAGFLLVFLAAILLLRRLVPFLKERITYPRTGYVSYRQVEKNQRGLRMAAAMIIGATVAALFAAAPLSLVLLPGVSGLIAACAFLLMGSRAGMARFYLLAACSALLGGSLSLLGVGDIFGLGLYYTLFGLAILASGFYALARYLLENRALQEAD